MALKLLQPGIQPLGQYDGLDSEVLLLKGGEVVTFSTVLATSATDKAASDAFDGYTLGGLGSGAAVSRTVITKTLTGSGATAVRPLMLADEGIAGYGTLFGTVVGGTVGQSVSGAVLGPSTATGSGKVTCWDKPGLYAVSLDACDTTSLTGLNPNNTTIKAGKPLYATAAGLLTPNSALSFGASATADIVGRFVEFETNGSLVNTPNKLVAALNSPSGAQSSVGLGSFAFAVFHFNPML
jgi:hypothetical protein